jgi:hypothetical protein
MTQYTEYSLFQLLDATGFEGHQLLIERAPRLWPAITRDPLRVLRPRVNYFLHRLTYWARAQKRPSVFDFNLEAWTFKPRGGDIGSVG